MAFKANVDDIRGSLSYKLRKILLFEGAKVFCSDPYVKDKSFLSKEELLLSSEIIIVGTPHEIYTNLIIKDKLVIDIWNIVKIKTSK